MSSKPYNGFSGVERGRAAAWSRKQVQLDLRDAHPSACDVCGRLDGKLAFHSEDYSFPYGSHVGEYGLCYCCHMMIHTRYRAQQIFKTYRDHVRAGLMVSHPIVTWNDFSRRILRDQMKDVRFGPNPGFVKRERTLLDALSFDRETMPDNPPRGSRRSRQIGLFE